MEYIWFIWSLISVGIWLAIYLSLDTREKKKEMLIVSLWTSLLGLTEPIFVPEYWSPPSLFDLAMKTGFDIESLVFSFAIGGIAVSLYERILPIRHVSLSAAEQRSARHGFHIWALLSAPAVFVVLLLAADLNPIYSAVVAMVTGGLATWYCRPDLKKKMFTSAFIFLALYFLYFFTLIAMSPGYVGQVWNLPAISGILILGIPLEELLFAWSFGFIWSSVYEHVAWRKVRSIKRM